VSAFGRKADVFALTCPEEQAHCAGPGKKGRSMALKWFVRLFAISLPDFANRPVALVESRINF